MNTIKARYRILSLAVALCLLLAMVLVVPGPVKVSAAPSGGVGDANDGVDFKGLIGNGIYFGVYDHYNGTDRPDGETPILWRGMSMEVAQFNGDGTVALGDNPEQLVMYSQYVLDTHAFGSNNTWATSSLRTWLNEDFYNNSFSNAEKRQIVETTNQETLDHNNANPTYSDSHIYVPGYFAQEDYKKELRNYFPTDTDCIAKYKSGDAASYWLRSPSPFSTDALCVGLFGNVNFATVNTALGVRPAFRLNPESIIFTSEIGDAAGKPWITQADGTNYAAGGGRKNFKLTILSSSVTLTGLQSGGTTLSSSGEDLQITSGGELELTGTFNSNADNLVYKIVDRTSGTIVSYGVGTGSNLTVTGKTNLTNDDPLSVGTGDYTLYVWAQKNSTDYHSDEGSTPWYFNLKVEPPAQPTVQSIVPADNAIDVAITGSIEITFDKAMDTNEGNVSLTGGSGTLGATPTWTTTTVADDTYTISYADLEHDKEYTITLTGFKDTDGNPLDPNPATYTFHTIPEGPHVTPDNLTIQAGADDTFTVYFGTGPDAATSADIASDDPSTATVDIAHVDTDETVITVTGVAEGTTDITIKWDGGPQTATVSVTVTAAGTNPPDPGQTVYPTATPTSLPLDLDENTTGIVTLSLGRSGDGSPLATEATATSSNENAATVPYGPHDGEVTITAVGEGTAIITFTFDDPDETQAHVTVNVTDSDSGPGDGDGDGNTETPGGSSGGSSGSARSGRSGSSGGSTYTPPPKIQLPASAFSWDGDRTLTINHDNITPLGLLSVRWDGGADLTRGTDYSVFEGSVIVRFSEAFMAAQSPGEHTIRVEFLNHTGEATVTVGDTGLTTETDNLFDNDTHNPNTGGYPDGSYPGANDNPNTGDGRSIWPALLLGSMSGILLVVRRLKPVA